MIGKEVLFRIARTAEFAQNQNELRSERSLARILIAIFKKKFY